MEEFGIAVPSFRVDLTGLQDPYKVFGIAALVVVIAMVLHILMARVTPGVPPPGQVHLVAGAVVLALVAAMMLANHASSGSAPGSLSLWPREWPTAASFSARRRRPGRAPQSPGPDSRPSAGARSGVRDV